MYFKSMAGAPHDPYFLYFSTDYKFYRKAAVVDLVFSRLQDTIDLG
jgi:hypothetical protein